jgi:sigma-B regulation protein RsbU (phosphoserine phosphatase)
MDGAGVTRLEVGGTVLGLFEVARFQAGSVELQPGSVLAIFTDGVTEAFNAANEEFGEERLIDIIRQNRQRDPETIYEAVLDEVRQWQANLKQHDDITLLIAKVDGGTA